MNKKIPIVVAVIFLFAYSVSRAQENPQDSVWTLQKCILYALQQNVSVQQAEVSNQGNLVRTKTAKADRFPSVSASVSQDFDWSKSYANGVYGSYSGTNGTNYSVSSNVRLYNGFRTENSIKQSELSYKKGQYDVETMKENISLSVVDAYLQVLYADEQVKNSRSQVASTTEQLQLADERMQQGLIAKADYLQVKSELATENLTLANAQSQLTINKVNLMQLMELPVTPDFTIDEPNIDNELVKSINPTPDSVYQLALKNRPEIQSSALNKQVKTLGVSIAKSGYQPVLSLNGGISTGYQSDASPVYATQVENKIHPSVGLNLSIPIYQKRTVRSDVELAKLDVQNAELDDINTRNQLRKEIEQTCVDVQTAQMKYTASLDQYQAAQEAYDVAMEKFNVGLLNSADFMISKTSLITAQSNLLQSKYNLVFNLKILDYYMGNPITL